MLPLLTSMLGFVSLILFIVYLLGVLLAAAFISATKSKPESANERAIYALCLIFWPLTFVYYTIIVYKSKRKIKSK